MVVVFFALYSQIGVMLISPEQIELESCACAQIEALEEGNGWIYLDYAMDLSERGRNAANLMIHYNDSDGLFCPFSQIGVMVLLIYP